MYKVELDKFQGPLDLLLSLIEKEKLDICQISLAKITDSYLTEMSKLNLPGDEMADFLLIASKLLYIKSKELLPDSNTEEEEAEIADLEAKLLEYQKYKEIAEEFEKILGENNRGFARRAKNEQLISFMPPEKLNQQTLFAIFEEVLRKSTKDEKEAEVIEPTKINLEERREEIRIAISKGKKVSFRKLLANTKHKIEIIVTFLAILEMIKQREIRVTQDKNFADFVVEKV